VVGTNQQQLHTVSFSLIFVEHTDPCVSSGFIYVSWNHPRLSKQPCDNKSRKINILSYSSDFKILLLLPQQLKPEKIKVQQPGRSTNSFLFGQLIKPTNQIK
jgi:hypothetical protein